MTFVTVSVTLVPDTETAVTAFVALPTRTEKSPFAGEPVTASLIVRVTVFVPAFAATELIVGGDASIIIASTEESDPAEPAVGSVVITLLPSPSLIVPLFNLKGSVA